MRTTSSSFSINFLRVAMSSVPYPWVISSVNRFHVFFFHGPGTYLTRASPLKSLTSSRFPPRSHTNVRSEEHTSELQSRGHLVCRLLLEKKNFTITKNLVRLIPFERAR